MVSSIDHEKLVKPVYWVQDEVYFFQENLMTSHKDSNAQNLQDLCYLLIAIIDLQ